MELNNPELSVIAEIVSTDNAGAQLVSLNECTLMLVGGGVGEVIFN